MQDSCLFDEYMSEPYEQWSGRQILLRACTANASKATKNATVS